MTPYRLIGATLSPYSVKLRAIMRYRRLDFVWVVRDREVNTEVADVRPRIIPVLQLPEDGSYHVDSTPLAYRLEERHPGERSILPDDPVDRLLAHIIEDAADEFLNKALFHYRWSYTEDLPFILEAAAREHSWAVSEERAREIAEKFSARMGGKIDDLGAGSAHAPLFESYLDRFLGVMEKVLSSNLFFFGKRPSLAEFGIFGQLYTMSFDPAPMRILRQRAPRSYQWVFRIDDLSGIEPGPWRNPADNLDDAVTSLLMLAAETHLPCLRAQARARERGADTIEVEILGHPFVQKSFSYPAKCLDTLLAEYRALDAADRRRADALLEAAGALDFFASAR